jgi:hypothetical protein
VTFYERGKVVARRLGSTRGGRGSISIPRIKSMGGRRSIYAVVERGGFLRKRVEVATYRAPRAVRVARPRRVRASRLSRSRLRVSWRRVRGAARYRVLVRIGDGRVEETLTRRTSVQFGGFSSGTAVRASVVAIARDNRESATGRVRVRARRVAIRLPA